MVDEDSFYHFRGKFGLKILICQTIGMSLVTILPFNAVKQGAIGNMLLHTANFIFFGVPLYYMENVVSQFTSRDCIEVWRIRPVLSHIGYLHVVWHFIVLIINHVYAAFALHYFFISFEKPTPYYTCGSWADPTCDIATRNFTIYNHCVKTRQSEKHDFCENLYLTFPEFQYLDHQLLHQDESTFAISPRILVASAILCVILFFSCFKRQRSMAVLVTLLTFLPAIGYICLLIGSMIQKGLTVHLFEIMDIDFQVFAKKAKLGFITQQIIYTLTTGSGFTFNVGCSSDFRLPVYVNVVITVVLCGAVSILTTAVTSMMHCPYAYEFSLYAPGMLEQPISILFEKMPHLIRYFSENYVYLITLFLTASMFAYRASTVAFYNLQEMLLRRYDMLAEYPGVTCLVLVLLLFVFTLPLMSAVGCTIVLTNFRLCMNSLPMLMVVVECFVFVLWYGLGKFSEDIHFMNGIRPSIFLKLSWIVSSPVLVYVFFSEAISCGKTIATERRSVYDIYGFVFLILSVAWVFLGIIVKLVIAFNKGAFRDAWKLDPTWGPKNAVLQRSRAMFTAQAMTKEYLYRQYHLQAGILARQRKTNVRQSRVTY